ncbi:MAG: hypothetical protein WEA58_04660 [Balneolaceae bacterium]
MNKTAYTVYDNDTQEFTLTTNIFAALMAWFNLYNRTGQQSQIVVEHPSGLKENAQIDELYSMLPEKDKKAMFAGIKPPPGFSLN